MSFGFSIGDFIAVGELAFKLYRDCYQVARGAPQEFQLLVGEISTLSNSLEILKQDAQSPNSLLAQAGESRARLANDVVEGIFDTLKTLEKSLKKYKTVELNSKGRLYWAKLRWSMELSSVEALRNKLTYRNAALSILLASVGNSSVGRTTSSSKEIQNVVRQIKAYASTDRTDEQSSVPSISMIEDEKTRTSLTAAFMRNAEVFQSWTTIGLDQWVAAGRWWLARSRMEIYTVPADALVVPVSAYINLLKASWIFTDVITCHPQFSFISATTRSEVQSLLVEIEGEHSRLQAKVTANLDLSASKDEDMEIWVTTKREPVLRPDQSRPASDIKQYDHDSASLRSFADSGYKSETGEDELLRPQDEADELTSLLLYDSQLGQLFMEAFQRKKVRERFVSRFRALLYIYSKELWKEATNASHQAAASLVFAKAKSVVNKIIESYATSSTVISDEMRKKEVESVLPSRLESLSDSGSDAEELPEQPDSQESLVVSLEELKMFMISSQAFANLRSRFRRFVHPDPLNVVAENITVEYKTLELAGIITTTFNVNWEVGEYLTSELGYDLAMRERTDILASSVVVMGTTSKAYATTAANYMRWRWSRTYDLLEIVKSTIKLDSSGTRIWEFGPGKSLEVESRVDSGVISLRVIGWLDEAIDVAQQLAWITATYRLPVNEQVSYSEVQIERTNNMTFNIFPSPLEPVQQRASCCWLPLFINGIIARGFPIPTRNGEKGIELPFILMTSLAKVMYPVLHTDRVYLRGFSNLLFPTSKSSDNGSVQWHVMTSAQRGKHLPHGSIPSISGESHWLKYNDYEQLASAKRTFLGSCRVVNVHLGTQKLAHSIKNIKPSNAQDEKPAPGMTAKSTTIGTSGLGFFGGSVTMDFLLSKGLYSSVEQGYRDMMDHAKETPIIVYDNAKNQERAWLVPCLSLILHMAHIWAQSKTDLLKPIPLVDEHWDSGEAAFQVIRTHSRDEIRDDLDEKKKYCLRDLISRLLRSVDKLAEIEAIARLESGGSVKGETPKLLGWEMLDIVKGKTLIRRKQVSVNENWMTLGAERVVLLCQDLGDVIEPAPSVRLCSTARSMYGGHNRLTATVKCLQQLSVDLTGIKDDACLRLANKAYWLSPETEVFNDCDKCLQNGTRVKCAKSLQKLERNYVETQGRGLPPITGAVSFGKERIGKQLADFPPRSSPRANSEEVTNTSAIGLDHSHALNDDAEPFSRRRLHMPKFLMKLGKRRPIFKRRLNKRQTIRRGQLGNEVLQTAPTHEGVLNEAIPEAPEADETRLTNATDQPSQVLNPEIETTEPESEQSVEATTLTKNLRRFEENLPSSVRPRVTCDDLALP